MKIVQIEITGNGPPIVFLHGWGFDSTIWKPLIPQLAHRNQLFLVDLPGFGKSPIFQSNYQFENIVPDILTLLPENATWVGWSLGGLFATWVTIHYPHKVKNLITIASSPCFVKKENWPGLFEETLTRFSEKLLTNHQQTLLDFLQLQLRGSKNQDTLFVELKDTVTKNTPQLLALTGALDLLTHTDLRAELIKVTCPSLSILGQLDTIVPSTIAPLLPSLFTHHCCKVIKKTGHIPFLTHPELVSNLMIEFRDRHR